jgi:uncharacterized protein (DUF983 family)
MNDNSNYGGPGLASLLLVLFVGLKLTGVITWSWVWVLAPLWIPLLVLLGIVLIATAIYVASGR